MSPRRRRDPVRDADDQAKRKALAQRLKRIRIASGLKQEQAAIFSRTAVVTYQKWEAGKNPYSADDLQRLADALGQSAPTFLQDPDAPIPAPDFSRAPSIRVLIHPAVELDDAARAFVRKREDELRLRIRVTGVTARTGSKKTST